MSTDPCVKGKESSPDQGPSNPLYKKRAPGSMALRIKEDIRGNMPPPVLLHLAGCLPSRQCLHLGLMYHIVPHLKNRTVET